MTYLPKGLHLLGTGTSTEVNNAWNYTFTPPYAFIAWCSVKAQGQIYLYLAFTIFSS